ncbi:MAG: hypothetical protein H7335_01540 [Massilia sp.]|nr:hypothetical protein [Massilia sp.]
MKRLFLLLGCALVLSACSLFKTPMAPEAAAPVPVLPALAQSLDYNGVIIERIAFRPGVSSVTVERLGKQRACDSDEGAGLLTEPGPVEVYRMMCSSGKVFLARCELRQCTPM